MKASRVLLGLLPLAAFAGACGGFGAGDYRTYRVASSAVQLSDDCDQQNDPDDTNTLRSGGTVLLYAVAGSGDDVPYLDAGGIVLEGTATDEGFDFAGTAVDVQDEGDFKITSTTDYDVSVTLDGTTATGTFVLRSTTSCSGDCNGIEAASCTQTNDFIGVEVSETVSVPAD